ncbi:hypothetical protein HCA63_06920 [Listeria booriae]|uniref:hypothetical protein n=1 Tax=Listeria booriae TaxID=1552123 RepID=UPI0016236011|nr:hypothetical protein [Listeria booriae]MBC1888081.1 hypothetical protein [Listeria booriae]
MDTYDMLWTLGSYIFVLVLIYIGIYALLRYIDYKTNYQKKNYKFYTFYNQDASVIIKYAIYKWQKEKRKYIAGLHGQDDILSFSSNGLAYYVVNKGTISPFIKKSRKKSRTKYCYEYHLRPKTIHEEKIVKNHNHQETNIINSNVLSQGDIAIGNNATNTISNYCDMRNYIDQYNKLSNTEKAMLKFVIDKIENKEVLDRQEAKTALSIINKWLPLATALGSIVSFLYSVVSAR